MPSETSSNSAASGDDVLQAEELRMLGEIAFLATGRGDHVRAEKIFHALMALRPERDFPYIGLGVTYLNAGRILDAILVLQRGQAVAPDSVEMSVFLAFALRSAKRNAEASKLLASILEKHTEDTPVMRMARQLQQS